MIDGINRLKNTDLTKVNPKDIKQKNVINRQNSSYQDNIPVETYHAYHSVSFKGAVSSDSDIYSAYKEAIQKANETNPSDTASVAEAVEILKPLNLSEKKLLDYLMGCSFDSHDENVVINKLALYYVIMLHFGFKSAPASKIPNVIATSLDNENKCFSEKSFESLFGLNGKLRLSKKNSLKRVREDIYPDSRRIALVHKSQLTKEIAEVLKGQEQRPIVNFDEEEIFSIDLEKEKKELIDKLSALRQEDKISSDLYNHLKKSVEENNFNIKNVYSEHYSLLKDCKTLQEVKELYPEIKIPEFNLKDNKDIRVLRSRLAKEDLDKIGLDILKKIYIDRKPINLIIVDMDNSYPTTYRSMINSGLDFGKVPAEINAMIEKTDNLMEKFRFVDTVDDKDIEFLIRKNATKQSRIWAEYIGITNKYWHPVRAIAHKQKHPQTSYYQTDRLVDGYLFYLYKYKNKSIPSKNPFEQYADGKPFNKEKKAALEKIYFLYRNNYNPEILSTGFLEFKANFDKKAMEKSLTRLESHYKNTFSNWFMTKERRQKYEKALENSYRLLFEKLDMYKQSQKFDKIDVQSIVDDKLSNEELVDYISETEDDITENIQADFKRLRNIVKATCNVELMNLFNQYVGSNSADIDCDNFLEYKPIIENCIENNEISEPQKLIAMFKLHDMYMNYLFNSDATAITFADYIKESEEKYKNTQGIVNYSELNKHLQAEEDYQLIKAGNISEEKSDLMKILDRKFLSNNKNDYKPVIEIITMYDNLPEIFKTKFYTLAQESDKIRDIVFVEQLQEMFDKISSWNLDKPEIITMDADKIPQKVVITPKAKYELLEDCKGNIERFDILLNKFYASAQKRIGDRHGQGVKVLTDNLKRNSEYIAELKIQGSQAVGSKRLYAREPQPEDIQQYGNVKYVFDTLDKHL